MATKKSTKSAKATALKITPIDPEPKPKRKSRVKAPEQMPEPAQAARIEDPLGEPADGEGRTYLGDESALEADTAVKPSNTVGASAAETAAVEATINEPPALEENSEAATEPEETEVEAEFVPAPKGPAKLERLQKILSKAGIASRRKAEEMIEQGRVQVNGAVVTALGSKADASRDHIRVDGKLLHGAERHRYFVLNKPRGFVTTVSDPEHRPTVMTFFEKMRERLYPVGRLDYMSEGLLLMTNDGDLANRLTRAGSGVEKTYLVKIAGQPNEDELDKLRGGVAIDRGQPGSGKVHTAPARIRQVRQGDNPWYEVVLIEGRNRELRKMFSSIGHFVEKIRRVGYGPLVLDVEPGQLRELDVEELAALQLAAEGKLRTPKAKEVRRRNRADADLPTVRPKPSPRPAAKPFAARTFERGEASEGRTGEFRPKRAFSPGKPAYGTGKPAPGSGSSSFRSDKPINGERPARPAFRPAGEGSYRGRPAVGGRFESKPFKGKPATGGRFEERPFRGKPAGDKPRWRNAEGERPRQSRPSAGGSRPGGASFERPRFDRPKTDRPRFDKPRNDRPGFDRPRTDRPAPRSYDRPARSERTGSERARPPRENTGFERPFTPRSGPPRAGGPRPAGKPFKPGGQSGSRPAYGSGSRPTGGTDSRPRTESGARGTESRPKSQGYSKPGGGRSGFQNRGGARSTVPRGGGRPGGGRSSGPRPGGKRRP
jgi:pseudouridine synthase